MQKIAIMTDTNSGISPKYAKENGIFLLQMPFFVDGEEFLEYGSIDHDEFFARMTAGAEVSTSQPSPGALCELWEKILESYETIIYIPMSSALSGAYQTAKMLANDYDGRVLVVDNKRISVTLRSAVLEAVKMKNNGLSAKEICEKLQEESLNASIYVTVNTLEYLKNSGRVTPSGAAIGTLLGIKPVLKILGEKLDAYKKVRGISAAMDTMLQAVEDDIKNRFSGEKIEIRAAYTGKLSQGEEWQTKVAERFSQYEIGLDVLPLSIACHLGPGALGIGINKIV
ncbi:MAG: DegV family protein [Clostridia bacterium]|nr:DegV family protein [Clostridia bacterium]